MLKKNKVYNYDEVSNLIKKKQIYILNIVTEICYKYELQYWLDAGTLLGAVRHKGFIPWDDDIDIGMMRDDYEQLINILKNELPSDLLLQTIDTDTKYGLMFAKVRDRHSYIHGEVEYDYNGVFIDIFPFDYISESIKVQKIQRTMSQFLISLRYSKDYIKRRFTFIKKIILFFMTYNYIYKTVYQILLKFSFFNKSTNQISNGVVCPWAFFTSIRDKTVYLPTKLIFFEGKEYNAPNNSHLYLKSLYGENYMVPLKNTHVAHIHKITLDENFWHEEILADENINS